MHCLGAATPYRLSTGAKMATYRCRHYTQLTPHATHHNTQHPTPSIYLCCFGYYYPSVETHFAVLAQTYVTSCLPFPCFSIVCVSAGVYLSFLLLLLGCFCVSPDQRIRKHLYIIGKDSAKSCPLFLLVTLVSASLWGPSSGAAGTASPSRGSD